MLSDSCDEFLIEMYEDGVTDDMYTTLRKSIRHYKKAPFNYPPEVCDFLVAAIDAIRKPKQKIGTFVFVRLLLATSAAYWSSDEKEARLPQTLRKIWRLGPI